MSTTQFATTEEISFYIRATFKQLGISDVSFSFKGMKRSLGYYWAEKNEIVLSFKSLENFTRFKTCLLHEASHALQYRELGTFKTLNGRNDFHGKTFKKYCKLLGISSSRFVA